MPRSALFQASPLSWSEATAAETGRYGVFPGFMNEESAGAPSMAWNESRS